MYEQPEICPSCKNEDTQRLIDKLTLAPYKEFHGGSIFRLHSCHTCGATWHWKVEPHGTDVWKTSLIKPLEPTWRV